MALTTYAELKTAIASFLARSDLTTSIPDFITLAQSRMYAGDESRGMLPLRIRAMHNTADLSPSSGTASLPSGFMTAERLYVDEAVPVQLDYLPPEDFWTWSTVGQSGTPRHYTIEGDTVRFQPANTSTVKLGYYAKLTAMSDDADYDWILTNAPHVYLNGALAEAYDFILDTQRAEQYFMRFASAVRALHRQDEDARTSGSVLQIRPRSIA